MSFTRHGKGRTLEEQKICSSAVQKYFYQTTTHGIPAVYFNEGKTKKVIWSIIFFALLGSLSFNVANLLSEYFSYPIYQRVRDERPTEVKFPSVTICTASDYSKSSVTNETLENVGLFVSKIENNEVDYDSFGEWRNKMEQEHLTHVHTTEFQHKVKSEFRPMLLKSLKGSCSFSTVKSCNYSRDFKLTFPSNEDKLCYTFNHNKSDPYFQRGNGPLFGLSMVLYVNQSDYVPAMGFDNGIGLTVYIHAVNTYPFLGVHAISVPPGYSSNIAMHKIVTTRLPPPYPSRCTDGQDILNIFPGDYTAMSCEVSCQYDYIYKKCGSIEPFMRSFMPPEQYPRTKSSDVEDVLECRNRILMELYEHGFHEKCNCPPPCVDEVYHHIVSMTKWPALVDIPLYRIAFAKALSLEPNKLTREFIRSNFLQIRVYFDELGYKHVYEQCKISLAELFSNLGGQLGLWIGYSLFSIIELMAMLVTVAYLFVKQKCTNRTNVKSNGISHFEEKKSDDENAQ
ncbi:amiloride-sensitive sodium channel subunit alpha-like [Rhopilema esculentum]|uniref:amiloride-sensitive sodium channel subunit alpha-like n=1 Tax=Rhopilema esculentum TaxID=499914 RepID=UPI0031D0EF51